MHNYWGAAQLSGWERLKVPRKYGNRTVGMQSTQYFRREAGTDNAFEKKTKEEREQTLCKLKSLLERVKEKINRAWVPTVDTASFCLQYHS